MEHDRAKRFGSGEEKSEWQRVLRDLGCRMQAQMEAQGLTPYRLERLIGLPARVVRRALAGADIRASHWLQLAWVLDLSCDDLKDAFPPRPDLAVPPQVTTEERIVEFLRVHRGRYRGTVSDLAKSIGRSVSQTYRSLHRLQERGRIRWEKLYGSVYTFRLLPHEEGNGEEKLKVKE